LNITPEEDLTRRRRHCRCFLRKETVVAITTITNDIGSQQWQWWGQARAVETDAAVGAHNNQPTNGSNMAAETAFAAAEAATAAAVAAAVATAATAAMAEAQTAAVANTAREIYIKKGRKQSSCRIRR
jgi:hypothetical protein